MGDMLEPAVILGAAVFLFGLTCAIVGYVCGWCDRRERERRRETCDWYGQALGMPAYLGEQPSVRVERN